MSTAIQRSAKVISLKVQISSFGDDIKYFEAKLTKNSSLFTLFYAPGCVSVLFVRFVIKNYSKHLLAMLISYCLLIL